MKHNKLVLLFAVSLVVILSLAIPEKPQVIKDEISPPAVRVLTPQEFLKQEIIDNGLTGRDYLIMKEIIQCESGWQQRWPDGTIKVSNGNIGLAQINKGAHHVEYERLGLDPYDPYDNIRYAIILYKRGGIIAWKQWSGHCFLPKLIKQGIIIK
jgi:hypothetical protein